MLLQLRTIAFLLLLTACGPSESADKSDNIESDAHCIESILEEDNRLGEVRNHACEHMSLEQTIEEYTKALEQLDYSNCPEGFTTAFNSHIQAWKSMIPTVESYSDLRGEMHDLFDQIEATAGSENFSSALAEVWETWGAVETALK